MKTAHITTFGNPDVLSLGEAALRDVQAGEVLVRIEAASLNPLDVKIVAGYMQEVFPVSFPYVPGTDFSGVVEKVGAEVTRLQTGHRVFGRSAPSVGGGLAQRLVISSEDLCVMPAEMSFEQAASLPTTFGTAHLALFKVGRLERGQRVLIHAAAGGVGIIAIQLARLAGAYVIATASGANIDLVKSLGADEVINYRSEDFAQLRDVDLVLDPIGGDTLEKSWAALRDGGRIATLVEFGISPRNGCHGEAVFFQSATSSMAEAVALFRAGKLQIVMDSVFPLDEARAALEKQATGHARGKVLVRTCN